MGSSGARVKGWGDGRWWGSRGRMVGIEVMGVKGSGGGQGLGQGLGVEVVGLLPHHLTPLHIHPYYPHPLDPYPLTLPPWMDFY